MNRVQSVAVVDRHPLPPAERPNLRSVVPSTEVVVPVLNRFDERRGSGRSGWPQSSLPNDPRGHVGEPVVEKRTHGVAKRVGPAQTRKRGHVNPVLLHDRLEPALEVELVHPAEVRIEFSVVVDRKSVERPLGEVVQNPVRVGYETFCHLSAF